MHIFRLPGEETHRESGQRHEGCDHYLRRQTQPWSSSSTWQRWRWLQHHQQTYTNQHSNGIEAIIQCHQPFFPSKFSSCIPARKFRHVRNRNTSIIVPISNITWSASKFPSFGIWISSQGRSKRRHILHQLISIIDFSPFLFVCSFVNLVVEGCMGWVE